MTRPNLRHAVGINLQIHITISLMYINYTKRVEAFTVGGVSTANKCLLFFLRNLPAPGDPTTVNTARVGVDQTQVHQSLLDLDGASHQDVALSMEYPHK